MTDRGPTNSLDACPLSWPEQRRNLVLFAACTGMQYLAAPVLYVGITQASLCDRLGADARTSNLPGTLFFAMTAMPAIIAWLSPRVASLKRNLMLCYATSAVMLAAMAITLALPIPTSIKIAMVILQGGISGAVMPAAIAFLWEVIGRGSAESRRGLALSLGFGAGPILAVLGSFGQDVLLGDHSKGAVGGKAIRSVAVDFASSTSEIPDLSQFALLFAVGAPVMGIAAFLSRFFVVPPVDREPEREPLSAVASLLIGVPLMIASVAFLHAASVTDLPVSAKGDVSSSNAPLEQAPSKSIEPSESVTSKRLRLAGYVTAVLAAVALIYHFRA